nr:hypothetical protein [Tanacetum cinerariifolium]
LLRQSQTNDAALTAYVKTQMATLQTTAPADGGFITADVVAQPGYTQNTSQQNPFYTRYGLTASADQLFSQAEAETRGLFTGGDASAKTDFNAGILASFTYFYRPATVAVTNSTAGVTEYNTYVNANTSNPLVNYDLAPSNGALGKQSVII